MQIKLAKGVPLTEVSRRFLQGMADRMGMSFFKYGPVADAYPEKVSALGKLCDPTADPDSITLADMGSLGIRLRKFMLTGNGEWLMDSSNFIMIEFDHPAHPEAHFESTDSSASPGRKWNGERDYSKRGNKDL
jgi:hypothetical protein